MPMTPIANSSYLDFTGYGITNATTVEAAYNLNPAFITPSNHPDLDVALILPRAQDPTALLASDWGAREQTLAQLNGSGTLWTTYGADPTLFNTVENALTAQGLTILNGSNGATDGNYVSSAASRTIWVQLNSAADFQNLFGTPVQVYDNPHAPNDEFHFWNGNLSLPSEWQVQGLWFDTTRTPTPSDMTPGVSVTLPQGPQSVGNASGAGALLSPAAIAQLYNFPLEGLGVQTAPVGLIEPGIGSALRPDQANSFQTLTENYLAKLGQVFTGQVNVQGADGQVYGGSAGERSLDVGVVSSINPNGDITLYNGSGNNGHAGATVFTAIQSAIFDGIDPTSVLSTSFTDGNGLSPGSPFYEAYRELLIDAALSNMTFLDALGDGGSGGEIGNGLPNVFSNITSPFGIMVGGTSLSTFASALADPTLAAAIVEPALAGDPAMLWHLVAGGLTSMPTQPQDVQYFVEAVWNQYLVQHNLITTSSAVFDGGYLVNTTGAGGVDITQAVPAYQLAYGLDPMSTGPSAQVGRGVPDVSANAGGNLEYLTPGSDMMAIGPDGGTSAATPLWAALVAQLDTIFHDQGLPNLGYMNDLLYIASAIAPPSFNDVMMGNNVSSFTMGGAYQTLAGDDSLVDVTPTGFGYAAGPGYDLTTGLGTPNGVLLARALTTIAHSEMWFASSPDMIGSDGHGGWVSGADQSLLFQTMSAGGATVGVADGPDAFGFFSTSSDTFAWTSRLAQQSLEADFDPRLVVLFDKQSQGAVMQSDTQAGDALSVSINSASAQATQGSLSSSFGFADFTSAAGDVRVARPVAVAETADGASDQLAIVRLRQDGVDTLSITFYRVDDLNGTINGVHPGDPGYHAMVQSRAYQATSGGTSIGGPGYGNYEQTSLQHVNAGDLVAMQLTNYTTGNTFSGFAQANETVNGQHVGHLWNYGLNTWGWEDTPGGGDHDYNDLVVGLDFTSASGHGWLT